MDKINFKDYQDYAGHILVWLDTQYKSWRDNLRAPRCFILSGKELLSEFNEKIISILKKESESKFPVHLKLLYDFLNENNVQLMFFTDNYEKPLLTYQKLFNDYIDYIIKKLGEIIKNG